MGAQKTETTMKIKYTYFLSFTIGFTAVIHETGAVSFQSRINNLKKK